MANYKTGAQRYNDRMDKIFEKSKALGNPDTLHGSKIKLGKDNPNVMKKIKKIARKMAAAGVRSADSPFDIDKLSQ